MEKVIVVSYSLFPVETAKKYDQGRDSNFR